MTDAIDTTAKPRTPPARFRRTTFTADTPRGEPQGERTVGLYLLVTEGNLYAVEMAEGWRPCRAIGPLRPDQVHGDLSALDWSQALSAADWDAARLVRVCDAERDRMKAGKGWERSGNRGDVKRAALTPKDLTQPQRLQEVKAEAESAIMAGQNVASA